jgi:hypothetical protein
MGGAVKKVHIASICLCIAVVSISPAISQQYQQQRRVYVRPQIRVNPIYRVNPRYHPNVRVNPGFRGAPHIAGPGMGPHGHPMVKGVRGWHEAHNRSRLRGLLPGFLFGTAFVGQDVDIETFIDGIDLWSPLEPIEGCTGSLCPWGALYVSLLGATGGSWSAATREDAVASAQRGCLQASQGSPCGSWSVVNGSAWAVALYCERYEGPRKFWTGLAWNGNDFGAALRNAYRQGAQHFGFNSVDECAIMNAIAADGSQQQYVQLE